MNRSKIQAIEYSIIIAVSNSFLLLSVFMKTFEELAKKFASKDDQMKEKRVINLSVFGKQQVIVRKSKTYIHVRNNGCLSADFVVETAFKVMISSS